MKQEVKPNKEEKNPYTKPRSEMIHKLPSSYKRAEIFVGQKRYFNCVKIMLSEMFYMSYPAWLTFPLDRIGIQQSWAATQGRLWSLSVSCVSHLAPPPLSNSVSPHLRPLWK